MTTAARLAREEITEKRELENEFAIVVSALMARIARDFTRALRNDGEIIQASNYQLEIEQALTDHYQAVRFRFDNRISNDLPEDLKPSDDEIAEIAAALSAWLAAQAVDQANIITQTTDRNISDSINRGFNDSVALAAEEGREVSPQERALITGNILAAALASRVVTIANYETQIAAEVSKQTEAEVLSGRTPSIAGGPTNEIGPTKEWVTAGDDRVRTGEFDHMAADGQEVDVAAPFVVSGQQLRWPGDTELGASLGNVINCRCVSVVSRASIEELRRLLV